MKKLFKKDTDSEGKREGIADDSYQVVDSEASDPYRRFGNCLGGLKLTHGVPNQKSITNRPIKVVDIQAVMIDLVLRRIHHY